MQGWLSAVLYCSVMTASFVGGGARVVCVTDIVMVGTLQSFQAQLRIAAGAGACSQQRLIGPGGLWAGAIALASAQAVQAVGLHASTWGMGLTVKQ